MSRTFGQKPPPKQKPPVGRKLHGITCSAKTDGGRCQHQAAVWAVVGWCDEHKPKGV